MTVIGTLLSITTCNRSRSSLCAELGFCGNSSIMNKNRCLLWANDQQGRRSQKGHFLVSPIFLHMNYCTDIYFISVKPSLMCATEQNLSCKTVREYSVFLLCVSSAYCCDTLCRWNILVLDSVKSAGLCWHQPFGNHQYKRGHTSPVLKYFFRLDTRTEA